MKVSYVQLFDSEQRANEALAYAVLSFPNNENRLISNSTQIQVLGRMGNQNFGRAYGALDDEITYLVLSIAK